MHPFAKKSDSSPAMSFSQFEFAKAIKPHDSMVFHSDYFVVDGYYATIMAFFHREGASDDFGAFWGISRIPSGLGEGVTTVNIEQVKRMGESWVTEHQRSAERVNGLSSQSQEETGSVTNKLKVSRERSDYEVIAQEITNGASYLNVKSRILVKAPTLEALDDAVKRIESLYNDRLGSIWAAAYAGQQRQEMSSLLRSNRVKAGHGHYFTSTEFAGAYSLVTHGVEDPGGEYVGAMIGDVNNSAVLFDVDNFKGHAVVATDQTNSRLIEGKRLRLCDMWGAKMSQACLLNGSRVVHVVLNGADVQSLGPKMEKLTRVVDMNHGDVNMFEMFGSVDDELSVFPTHMRKLTLMAEQAYESTDSDRSVIRGTLESVATQFYIDNRMWAENAKHHRDRLRVVGLKHEDVPRLEMFVSYLDMGYKALASKTARDDEKLHAYSVLASTFHNMLSNNGDLFNTVTSSVIDSVGKAGRVIYDFSSLLRRGRGVAMAQLVNIIGFAVGNLGARDLVVIHGADAIAERVRDYVGDALGDFVSRGGRVAWLYPSVERMFADQDFNRFDEADYTLLGNMSAKQVDEYQKRINQQVPADLAQLLSSKEAAVCYLRRGFDNVVFEQDLQLIPPKARG